MAATLRFISLLGTSSPHPVPSCSSSNVRQQHRSVHYMPHQQRSGRRLRAARAVQTDAPGAEPAADAAAPEEPPSVDFAFVSVSSSVLLLRSVIDSAFFFLPSAGIVAMTPHAIVAASVAAGRDAGRTLPDGVWRAEAQGYHARRIYRPLRALRECCRR